MPKFERIAVKVRHRGDMLMEVNPYGGRAEVTVPEFSILQYLHGEDAVLPLAVGEPADRPAADEHDRLARTYDIASNRDETGMTPTRRLFPARNNLPTNFADIQVALKGLPKLPTAASAKPDETPLP